MSLIVKPFRGVISDELAFRGNSNWLISSTKIFLVDFEISLKAVFW
jgi:hypothetical protein